MFRKILLTLAALIGLAGPALAQTINGNTIPYNLSLVPLGPGVYTALGSTPTGTGVLVLQNGATLTGTVEETGAATVTNFYTSPPTNIIAWNGAGAYISVAPLGGHVPGDTLRTSNFTVVTTQAGVFQQEYDQYFDMANTEGDNPPWQTTTMYTAGQHVNTATATACNDGLTVCVYTEVATSCTSASTGTGPYGSGTGIVDGTCIWNYAAPQINTGKIDLGIGNNGYTGGGPMWGMAIDVVNYLGYDPKMFNVGIELDRTFSDGDHAPGTSTGGSYGIALLGGSSAGYAGTAAVFLSSSQSTAFYHWGFAVNGAHATSDAAFYNSSTATYAFYNAGASATSGFLNSGNDGTAGYYDNQSAGIDGFKAAGYYTGAAFDASLSLGSISFLTCTNCSIRDNTNGASTMYFDVSFGGTTAGGFQWRTESNATPLAALTSSAFTAYEKAVIGSSGVSGVALSIQNSTGTCTMNPTTTTWSCSSDARLKTDIVDDENDELNWVDSFRIRDYTLLANHKSYVGVIAQEVNINHPDMVSTLDNGYLGVEAPSPWRMLRAEQQIQDEIVTLRARVVELERAAH